MTRSADAAVGMMDTAYFVGRGELLEFFNELLALRLSKIEQTASGAVACQLTEYIFPGSIPMSRVNWEAKSDYEFVSNYKLLQAAFNKHSIRKHVDVDKLIRAKYQDNLEFCQWLKAFYDQSGAFREDYDPVAVRARGKGGNKFQQMLEKTASKAPRSRNPSSPATRRTTRPAPRTTTRTTTHRSTSSPENGSGANPLKASENKSKNISTDPILADATLMKKNAEMSSKITELESSVVELEKERDFYFSKLRNVEFMLQVQQDKGWEGTDLEGVVGDIFKVLYATAEDDVAINEEGEVVPAGSGAGVDVTVGIEASLLDDDADENLLTAE